MQHMIFVHKGDGGMWRASTFYLHFVPTLSLNVSNVIPDCFSTPPAHQDNNIQPWPQSIWSDPTGACDHHISDLDFSPPARRMKEELQYELAWVVELKSNPAPLGHEVIELYVFFSFCICPSLMSAAKHYINHSSLNSQDHHHVNLTNSILFSLYTSPQWNQGGF